MIVGVPLPPATSGTPDSLKWGTFIDATGRKWWNSVTLTVTCRRH